MALKILVNQKRINDKKELLKQIRKRSDDIQTRESECEKALNELTAESTEEERLAVEQEADSLDSERTTAEEEESTLEGEIAELEKENKELIKKQERAAGAQTPPEQNQTREVTRNMETRKFFGMSFEQRNAFFADENVKSFLKRTRELMKTRDSITGSELIIPDNVLALIKQSVPEYSKLYARVSVRTVRGTARQPIMGEVPEAVWTEMCAKLNEVEIGFNMVEMDGYKLGAFFAVCNATLEDNDIALATELIAALSKGMAKALDKTILFGGGKDKKMPLGIVTRLLQKTAGSDKSASDRDFEDLSTTNVITIPAATKDLKLFQAIVDASGAISNDYAAGAIVWAMNRKTRTTLMSSSLAVNSNAAITAGIGNQMPGIGGDIEELSGNIIPDNIIVAGYYENYLLAERSGTTIAQSEHYRFIEDQTVFKATARYDGKPVIPEAFIVIGLNGVTPSVDGITFAGDKANAAE